MKFLIVDKNLITKEIAFAFKLFQNFLLRSIILPIRIFTTADRFLILFTKWKSNSFLHLIIWACTVNIWFIIFSFNTFLMIFLYSFCRYPILVFIIILKLIFWWLWILSFDRKDLIPLISDCDQECW